MYNLSSGVVGTNDSTTHWTSTSPLSLADYPEYQTSLIIWKICPPFIILLGAFGNIATVFIMRRIKDHNSSQHAVFMALAVSDFTFLCTEVTNRWLNQAFHVDLQLFHAAICKFFFWMAYVSGTTSSWLVTCVTVQRTMAVLWPHRMRVMCTVRRTWTVIVILVLAACALESHLLVGMEISEENRCQTMPGVYRYFYVIIFSWVYACTVSVFPSVCMFVCDIILSVTLFKAVSSSSIAARAGTDGSNLSKTDRRRKTSYRTTVMVLAISCAFLVLTLPNCIYLIWASYIFRVIKRHPLTVPMVNLVYVVIKQLWYMNSAINFFLYCLTGTKFRREFISWICCRGAQSLSAPSVHETASGASRAGRIKHHGHGPQSE